MSTLRLQWMPPLAGMVLFLAGCGTTVYERVYTPAPLVPHAKLQYCLDNSPHLPDATPFIYGGCDLGMPTTPELAAAYKKCGIVWQGNGCNGECNGLCPKGPHVAFGGHCLSTPTPGSKAYNDIVFGIGVTNWLYPLQQQ